MRRLGSRKVYQKKKKKVRVVIKKKMVMTSHDGFFKNKIDLSERFSEKRHMNFVPNFMFTLYSWYSKNVII
jgi:hypothetical protein